MQRAETLFPATARGLTAPSLYVLESGTLLWQANRLICSLLHLYQHFQYARKPDNETLLAMGSCPSLHIRTSSISGSYAVAVNPSEQKKLRLISQPRRRGFTPLLCNCAAKN